ncbi:MAG: hypothetical protein Q7J98_07110 [Kiritimatiellia bacterium]|nr:hypothetical protein [Kiritimatiellia bacterium]
MSSIIWKCPICEVINGYDAPSCMRCRFINRDVELLSKFKSENARLRDIIKRARELNGDMRVAEILDEMKNPCQKQ